MRNRIIIMGTAPCLEEDIINVCSVESYLPSLSKGYYFLAVGLDCADRYLGRIEHAVSYHPKEFAEFRKRREMAGGNLDYETHTHCMPELGHRIWPYYSPSGSSAMLGVEVAMGLGYKKIVVAGVLLTDKKYTHFQEGWQVRYAVIKDHVRAMSGYPRELLGMPTEEWLND